jgi:uncharacterized membrane protein
MPNDKDMNEKPYEPRSKILKIAIVAIIIVVIIAIVLYGSQLRKNEPDWTFVESSNGEIKINFSEINDGEIHYFKTRGSDYGFFIYEAPNNNIITRISICEPCDGDAFHIEDDGKIIVCNKCDTKWDAVSFKGISGGCINSPPPELHHIVEDGYIIIKEQDIKI